MPQVTKPIMLDETGQAIVEKLHIIAEALGIDAVRFTEQVLTEAQKAQARQNIGAPGADTIPTKVSDLGNDSGFQDASQVAAAVAVEASRATAVEQSLARDKADIIIINNPDHITTEQFNRLSQDYNNPKLVVKILDSTGLEAFDIVNNIRFRRGYDKDAQAVGDILELDLRDNVNIHTHKFFRVGSGQSISHTLTSKILITTDRIDQNRGQSTISVMSQKTVTDELSSLEQAISEKQDKINDLASICEGAGLGATAVQPSELGAYRTASEQDTIDADKENRNHIDEDTTTTDVSEALVVGKTYKYMPDDGVATLAFTLTPPTEDDVVKFWRFKFKSGATATEFTPPSNLYWPDGEQLLPEANTIYEVMIDEDYCVSVLAFKQATA